MIITSKRYAARALSPSGIKINRNIFVRNRMKESVQKPAQNVNLRRIKALYFNGLLFFMFSRRSFIKRQQFLQIAHEIIVTTAVLAGARRLVCAVVD